MTLFLICAHRFYLGDLKAVSILSVAIVIFLCVLVAVVKEKYQLASNVFCFIGLSLITYYMWTFEGARDEVAYLLPAIIAFSLLMCSQIVSIILMLFTATNILLLGYFTDVGIKAPSISTNSLTSSVLIVLLLSFSVFMYWVLLNYLNKTLKKVKQTLTTQNAILNNLGESLIITDPQGVIQQFSQSSLTMFGFNKHDLIGQKIWQLVPQSYQFYHELNSADLLEQHHEFLAYKHDGSEFNIKFVLTKTIVEQQVNYIVLISDISEQLHSQKQLKIATEIADAANLAKSEFLANMSHEIRTPMNGMMGSLQLLAREPLPPNSKELVSTAIFSSSSLLTIINDILDFSKIEAGKLNLELVPLNVKEVIKLIISETKEFVKIKQNKLVFTVDDNYKEGWLGDPVRVKQIILNLVTNSLKFTQSGLIEIKLNINEHRELHVSVTDTGIGMSNDEVQKLFVRFDQADSSTTRKFGGTGLGMAITQSLVEMMHGSVDVISEPKQGTSITIKLPLKPLDYTPSAKAKNDIVSVPDLKGKTILLAEDNKINQKIFVKMMKQTQATIHIVDDGKKAVKIMEMLSPDIIFMDIQMPIMDGIQACKLIKASDPLIPIIALTANVMVNDVKRYAQVGFDAHIGKPVNINELYRAVKWHIM